MNEFLQFLGEPIAQRSLWACAVIGFANGFVSALVVLRRSSLQIGTISCALLPGIALAILLFGFMQLSILIGAVIAGLLVGVLHVWKSNTLLSVISGTVCYMLLVQLVF